MNWLNYSRWLLDVVWLIFLGGLFRHFWRDRQLLVQAQSWLKTPGHILSCELTSEGNHLWPKIEYQYQVYEQDLTGQHLFLDASHNNPNSAYSRRIAYKAALAFKENKAIDVYYNPNNPEQSALDVTLPRKLNIILLLISAFIALQTVVMIKQFMGW